MEFIIQIIREFILELPGAYIRWCYFGKNEKFFKFVEEDKSAYNFIISFVLILVIVVIIVLFNN